MIVKASGRSALILATGIWVCFAGPSWAAADDAAAGSASASPAAPIKLSKYTKHASHHAKKAAHAKSAKADSAKSDSSKPSQTSSSDQTVTSDSADNNTPGFNNDQPSSSLPASIANANAKMASADTPDSNARAMTARASTILQNGSDLSADAQGTADNPPANMQVVAADQLNDVDRALHEHDQTGQRQTTLAVASAEPPAKVVTSDSNTWDETSLIGKIFIGFGAILTMASAARMFMA